MRRTTWTALAALTALTALVLTGAAAAESGDYELTVTMIGRDGTPAADNDVFFANYDDGTHESLSEPSGTVRLRLPRGDYFLQSAIHAGERIDRLTRPWLRLTGDTAVTFDARTTRPVEVTVERPDARLVSGVISSSVLTGKGPAPVPFVAFDDFANVGTAQLGPNAPADRLVGAALVALAAPGADGTFTDSPYSYSLAWFTPGRAYTGTRHVRDAELATVGSTNQPQGGDTTGSKFANATYTRLPGVATYAPVLPVRLPSARTELFTTRDISWQLELSPQAEPSPEPPRWLQTVLARSYQAGRRYRETWNGGGVFGPALPGTSDAPRWAVAYPGELSVGIPLYGTGPDVWGTSAVDDASTVMSRDGVEVCASDEPARCQVDGASAGAYRVRTEASRGFTDLSTRVSAEWTFQHDGREDGPIALPVRVVRFDAALDETNSAPGGRFHPVRVTVPGNPGAPAAPVRSLTVDVSYDDGATWRTVPVARHGDGGVVVLRHPASGYVSLRAKAVDTAGSSVDQTIIHAYRLR